MSVHGVDDLVPLRAGFDLCWRGYHREEVDDYVHDLEHDLRDLTADRDACTARAEHLAELLERSRAETTALRGELNRVCGTPFDIDVLPFRLSVMVEVATAEATAVLEHAQACWAAAQASAAKLRGHYDRLAEESTLLRDEIEAEREGVLRAARAQARALVAEAEVRQRELDAEAERAREQVEVDFKLAMDQRRAEALRALAVLRTTRVASHRCSEGQACWVRRNDCAAEPLHVSCTSWTLSAVEPFGTVRHLPLSLLTKWK